MTCKDCIHNCVCSLWRREEGQDAKFYAETEEGKCEYFEDKLQYLRIPVSINDTVYVPVIEKVLPFDVLSVNYFNDNPTIKAAHGIHLIWVFGADDIGKTVFPTKEEAEAEIERRKHERH